ncbi:MAG: heme exporter protein CcmD [Alteromonadaceae bacterium]|nr:MAG: heme exporter protein CcmD [Alteromonadaceae bacterium]
MELSLQFDSWQAFFTMQGHGVYVFACYAITVASFALLISLPRWGRKRLIKSIRAGARRPQH